MGERDVRGAVSALITVVLIAGAGMAATYHFSLTGTLVVEEGNVTVSQHSFSIEATPDAEVVKDFDVENSGNGTEIYFRDVIEGPEPDNVSVSFHRLDSTSITTSDKLRLPDGTEESPSEVEVHAHVEVDEDAAPGEYEIYVQAKET